MDHLIHHSGFIDGIAEFFIETGFLNYFILYNTLIVIDNIVNNIINNIIINEETIAT